MALPTDPITVDEFADLGKGPIRMTGDEGTVEERPIEQVIAADRYGSAKCISSVPYGLRIARIRFPGTQ